jgi:hypothetical protein
MAKPSRRAVLVGLTGLTATICLLQQRGARADFAAPRLPPPIHFDIVRAGNVIGTHDVEFSAGEDGLSVRTRIDAEVRVLGVNAFDFHHTGTEIWSGGRLQKFDSETLDEDSQFFVHGRASQDGFQINSRKGTSMAPADIMVASYWRPEIVFRTLLIDPQRGRLKQQRLVGTDRVTIPIAAAAIEATRYTVAGVNDGWVAYDERGRWLAAEMHKHGADILYRLRA